MSQIVPPVGAERFPEDAARMVDSYCTNGYVVASGLIDEATVAGARDLADGLARTRPEGTVLLAAPRGTDHRADMLAADGRLTALAGTLLRGTLPGGTLPGGTLPGGTLPGGTLPGGMPRGGAVECFGCTFVVKAAGAAGSFALFHQDGHPWERDLGWTQTITLWMALDPSGPAEGGLAVIPGSHRLAAQPLGTVGVVPGSSGAGRRPVGAGGIFGGGTDPGLVEEDKAVFLSLSAGDVSAHDPRLIHGSPANLSGQPRRALVLRYRKI